MTDTATPAVDAASSAAQTAVTQTPIADTANAAVQAGAAPAQLAASAPIGDLTPAAAHAATGAHEFTSAFIVDGTLWTLEAFSVFTWILILVKGVQHLRISYYNRRYSKQFWGAADFQAAALLENTKGPAARVAGAGFSTLLETDSGTTTHDLEHTGDRQELLDRKLRQQMQKERGLLESGLAILATIGSISPFVGLFGTVWGIMGALTNISKSGSASLEVVAGPIGEALVATAVGIAVAVPAVIAYNFFIRRNKVIWANLDDFAVDFVHLAQKTSFLIKRPVNAANSTLKVSVSNPKRNVISTQDDFSAEGVQI